MARVALARRARHWLANQIAYLLLHQPQAAERLETRMSEAIRRLEEFPRIGARGLVPGTRRLVIAPYVITYREGEAGVTIVDIRHARQRPPAAEDAP